MSAGATDTERKTLSFFHGSGLPPRKLFSSSSSIQPTHIRIRTCAIKRHEQSKTALQKFNDTWKIFRVLPFADAPTTTTEGEQDTPNHSTTRTEHADTEQDSEIRGTRLRKQRNREHEGAETQDSERTEQPTR